MAKRGRKPTDIDLLIVFENQWWWTFSNLRDGVPEREVHGVPRPPPGVDYPMPPQGMTHPGAIHDRQKEQLDQFLSRWEVDVFHVPGEPPERHLWEALKRAKTVRWVRRICRKSQWLGPSSLLYERAEEFVSALRDSRYARKASTKDDRRLLYCAQVMAGISLRIPAATAVDKLRKLKHGNLGSCHCGHCTNMKGFLLNGLLSAVDAYQKATARGGAGAETLSAVRADLAKPCRCAHCLLMASLRRKHQDNSE